MLITSNFYTLPAENLFFFPVLTLEVHPLFACIFMRKTQKVSLHLRHILPHSSIGMLYSAAELGTT